MTLSPNIVSNKLAVAERFRKLYRTLYHKFLKRDFIHKKDYLRELQQLNARITSVEANVNKEIAVLKADITASILGHTHVAPQAPAGSLPTGPGIPAKPPTPPIPSATPVIAHQDVFMEQQDALQQATGPAIAPLADGVTPESQKANIQAREDIGLV